MSYTRREVTDGVTIMNKDLYDNLQDGIDELEGRFTELQTQFDKMINGNEVEY